MMRPSLMNNSSSFGEYLSRILNISQMDFQYALWQMSRLLVSPSRVYNYTKTRQLIRGQFARDDPAFIVILLCLMITSNIIYTIFFGHHSFWNFIAVIVGSIIFDFLLMTTVLSSVFWFITNKYLSLHVNSSSNKPLKATHNGYNDGNKVEWLYSFDVHCNSYFIYFVISNIFVLILTPVLLQKSLFSLILGNSIYFTAIIAYFYVTFLGYDALPIIQQSEKLLYPLPIIVILYIISMLCHLSAVQSL
eukprot:406701_1